MSDMSFKV